MAYQIDRYNRTLLTVVEDGTVNETTDLKFIGKNYAGYGELHNENFLFLLENFASQTPPPRALSGQIWFDTSQSKLKFYDGEIWRSTGGSEVGGTQPTGLTTGDFWWDEGNDQLYVFNGNAYVLIGPQDAGTGTTQLVSRTIVDLDSISRSVIVAVVNDNPIYVISPTQFTILNAPENTLDGFTEIRQGVTLKDSSTGTTTSAFRFQGTASNAERLNGVPASEFVTLSNSNFTQTIDAVSGISINTGFDLTASLGTLTGSISNNLGPNSKIYFKAENALGDLTHSITIDATGLYPAVDNTFDLGKPNLKFKTIYAESFEGGSSAEAEKLKIDEGGYNSASVSAQPGKIVARSANNTVFANIFNGTATSAKYADLAEKYTTDQEYPVGTIMSIGGTEETTMAQLKSVAIGVVSAKPAYLMNSEAPGQALALKGRVPVRVYGTAHKGDIIYAYKDGVGTASTSTSIVGVALEDKESTQEGLVECVLKV